MQRVVLLSLLLVLVQTASVLGLSCPDGYLPYSSFSCVKPFLETKEFSAAQQTCEAEGGGLALVGSPAQISALGRYWVFHQPNRALDSFWVGYWYNGSDLVSVDQSAVSSVVTGSLDGSGSAGTGSCLSLGEGSFSAPGMFLGVNCSTVLPGYFCQVDYEVPTTDISSSSPDDAAIPEGSAVTLTCSFTGTNASVTMWMKDGQPISPTSENTLEIASFTSSDDTGDYECLVESPAGSVWSTLLSLDVAGSDPPKTSPSIDSLTVSFSRGAAADNQAPRSVPLGSSPVLLQCNASADGSVQFTWFKNGQTVQLDIEDGVSSSFKLSSYSSYSDGGVYQCRATNKDSWESSTASITIAPLEGTPGPVIPAVVPIKQTQLQVVWGPPAKPNTDSLLLRYQIFYSEKDSFDCSTASVLPVDSDAFVPTSSGFMVGDQLVDGLKVGTSYQVVVAAYSPSDNPSVSLCSTDIVASVNTFGTVPTNPVNVTSVLRTEDNHSIVAYWEELQTTLPEGELVRYDVEYRDAPQGEGAAVSVVHVPAQYAFVVISGVENANSYEVRVRGVVMVEYPDKFEGGPWSGWRHVDGIATNVPTTGPASPPTQAPGKVSGAVVAAVVVVVILLLAIVGTALAVLGFLYFKHRKGVTPSAEDAVDAGRAPLTQEEEEEEGEVEELNKEDMDITELKTLG